MEDPQVSELASVFVRTLSSQSAVSDGICSSNRQLLTLSSCSANEQQLCELTSQSRNRLMHATRLHLAV